MRHKCSIAVFLVLVTLLFRSPSNQHLLLSNYDRFLDCVSLSDLSHIQGRHHSTDVVQAMVKLLLGWRRIKFVHVECLAVLQDILAVKVLERVDEIGGRGELASSSDNEGIDVEVEVIGRDQHLLIELHGGHDNSLTRILTEPVELFLLKEYFEHVCEFSCHGFAPFITNTLELGRTEKGVVCFGRPCSHREKVYVQTSISYLNVTRNS